MQSFLLSSTVILWIVVVFNLLLTLVIIRRLNEYVQDHPHGIARPSAQDLLPIGVTAPEFTAQTLNGEEVISSNYLNEVSVFGIISPSCSPCEDFVNKLNELYVNIKNSGLNITLIGDSSLKAMQEFAEKSQTPFPILVAPHTSNPFIKAYNVPGTPVIYVLDEENKIKWSGFVPSSNLEEWIVKWAT